MPLGRLGLVTRVLAAVIGAGMLVCGVSGRDLVGGALYLAVGGYSVCAWTLLALFSLTLVWAGQPEHPHPERSEGSPPPLSNTG